MIPSVSPSLEYTNKSESVVPLSSVNGTFYLPDWRDQVLQHYLNTESFPETSTIFQNPPPGTLIDYLGTTDIAFTIMDGETKMKHTLQLSSIDITPPTPIIEGVKSGETFLGLNNVPTITVNAIDNFDSFPIVTLEINSQTYTNNKQLNPGFNILRATAIDSSGNVDEITVVLEVLTRPRYTLEGLKVLKFICNNEGDDNLHIETHLQVPIQSKFDITAIRTIQIWFLDNEGFQTLNQNMVFPIEIFIKDRHLYLEFQIDFNLIYGCPKYFEITGTGSSNNSERYDIYALFELPIDNRRLRQFPTSIPSPNPSSSKESFPTSYPSLNPSMKPSVSRALTSKPSTAPTKPSTVPTELFPSVLPSDSPAPSPQPSTSPTKPLPSLPPSDSPFPSPKPSISPTQLFPLLPSLDPTPQPSSSPSESCVCEWKTKPLKVKKIEIDIGKKEDAFLTDEYMYSAAIANGGFITGRAAAYEWSPFSDYSTTALTPRSDAKIEYFLDGPEDKCFADWECEFRPQFIVKVFTNPPATAEAKGRVGIRGEAGVDFCGESIARGGLRKEDIKVYKIKASIGGGLDSIEANLEISTEVVLGDAAEGAELFDPSAEIGEGFINDGDVKNKKAIEVKISGDVEVAAAADGFHGGLFFDTGIAKARLNQAKLGIEVVGKCTEETKLKCTCQGISGNKKNMMTFTFD